MAIITGNKNYFAQQYYHELKEMILQMKLKQELEKYKNAYTLTKHPPVQDIKRKATIDFPELSDAD